MQSASKTVICIIKPILLIKTFSSPSNVHFNKIEYNNNLIITTYCHQKVISLNSATLL